MRLPARLRVAPAVRRRLMRDEPADLALTGGRVLNVFTGELTEADVGIVAGRIAWVGHGQAQTTDALDGRTVIPGLIDAHAHGDIACTPGAFVREAVRHGTTTIVLDAYALLAFLDDAALRTTLDALEATPLKVLWGMRPARDAGGPADDQRLPLERLLALLDRPGVASTGELTAWRALLTGGDARVAAFVDAASAAGLAVDGHLPGASPRTLARLAAYGVTSDHEAIDGDELAARVEAGFWTMVRHSSLRADGPALGRAIVAGDLPRDRLLLTADGVTPQDLVHGHLDTVARRVVEGGVDPADAVRMATLHPATYLGLDAHIGSLAPGRCADLVVVDSLDRLVPERVMCDGRWIDEQPPDPIDWARHTLPIGAAPIDADAIARACATAPPLRLGGVIARLDEQPAPGPTHVALVARDGSTITGTTTRDFAVRAVATTITATMDVLLIGDDADALAAAYRRVVACGGGLACAEGDADVPLPVFGHLSPLPVPDLAAALTRFERCAALPAGGPPFIYRSLFLTLPALPGICLTPAGLLDVRAGELLTRAVAFLPNGW